MAVSSSSVKGFKPRKTLVGVDLTGQEEFLLGNSREFTIGDMVRLDTSGVLKVCAAGEPILGRLAGIVDQNGINVFETGRATGTTGSTLSPDDTITTSSTNTSDATRKLKGQVEISIAGNVLYSNDADGDLAQTNVGQLFDLTSGGDQVAQSTASDTSGQVQLVKLDPDGDADASKGLFRIVETQLISQLGNSTAVVGA